MHRLDLSLEREFDLGRGTLTTQVGAINAYDRRNMFYYDLFSAGGWTSFRRPRMR